MAKTDLTHQFQMATLSRRLPNGLLNMHSSHPEPLPFAQLAKLIHFDGDEFFTALNFDYASVHGSENLRERIVQQHYHTAKASDIITTCGAQEALFMVMNALLSAGDEVLCLTPIFEPLYQEALATGAAISRLPLLAESGWDIDWSLLEQSISEKTRLLIINFPHNPTGAHISKSDLQRLIDLCRNNDCWLLSDEVFRGLEHNPEQRLSAAVDLYDKAISIAVLSKAYGLPAVRLGWIACRDAEMRQRLEDIKRHLSICGSGLDEAFAIRVLPHSEAIFKQHVNKLKNHWQQFSALLANQNDISCVPPVAGATCFPLLKTFDADYYVKKAAEQWQLMLLPGSCFITARPGFRLTLGHHEATIHYAELFEVFNV